MSWEQQVLVVQKPEWSLFGEHHQPWSLPKAHNAKLHAEANGNKVYYEKHCLHADALSS